MTLGSVGYGAGTRDFEVLPTGRESDPSRSVPRRSRPPSHRGPSQEQRSPRPQPSENAVLLRAPRFTQIGSAPYTITKRAAVAFAEWLAVTYGDRGLHVACVCPMGVDTAMLRAGLDRLEGASVAAERVLSVEEAADAVVAGLRSG